MAFWYNVTMPKKESILIVCTNRKAYHDYFVEDTYQAGLELLGAEVKSIRQKELSLEGSFVRVENGQARVYQMHVKPYKFNSLAELGYALVPLEVYFKNGWAKLKLALAKGKHTYDKRESLKKKDLSRDMEKQFKNTIKF